MKECYICKAQSALSLVECYENYRLYRCEACGVIFCDPMKPRARQFYEEKYDGGVRNPLIMHLDWKYKIVLDRLTFCRRGRLLDLGCGTGLFLAFVQRRYGWRTTGVDFNVKATAVAKEILHLENIYTMSFEEFFQTHDAKQYDAITFFEVLEHLDDPLSFLLGLRKFLTPGGYIGLSVPNRDNFYGIRLENDSPPYHLTRWNKKALMNVLNIAGYEVVKIYSPARVQEVIGRYIRIGIGRRMLCKAKQASLGRDGQAEILRQVACLAILRDWLLSVLALPANLLLRLIRAQGLSLVALARNK